MSDWTLRELEKALSKLESEIASKEDQADELRLEILKLTPRAPRDPFTQTMIDSIKKYAIADITKPSWFYPESFAKGGHKIGATLKIKLPNEYTVKPDGRLSDEQG